jgi:hypothetical protein
VGAGALSALSATVPAAIRIADVPEAVSGVLPTWMVLAGAAVLPTILATAALRGARSAMRAFTGAGWPVRGAGIALWATSGFAWLTAFGAVLRATTHHHGLAGVTFALFGGAGLFALGLVVARFVAVARTHAAVRLALFAGAPILAALETLLVLRIARPFAASFFVDVLAIGVALSIGSHPDLHPTEARRRPLAVIGPPLAAFLLALGAAALRASPGIAAATQGTAPLFAPFVDVFTHAVVSASGG